jgi:hypothetical protein
MLFFFVPPFLSRPANNRTVEPTFLFHREEHSCAKEEAGRVNPEAKEAEPTKITVKKTLIICAGTV